MISINTWYQKCLDCNGQSFIFVDTAENGRWRTKLCDLCDGRGWNDKVTPEMGKIIGGLAAFAINMVLDVHGGDENMGCCPLCCAPCASLKRLRDIGAPVGNWVNLASGEDWDSHRGYTWQLPGGDVNWDLVTERWNVVDCHEGMEDDGDQLGAPDHGAVSGGGAGEGGGGAPEPVH